jgi:hypothetical protein
VGKIRPITQSAADVIAPAIAISEQTIIEVDQQNSFFNSNYFLRQRDGSLSRFPLPAPLNA